MRLYPYQLDDACFLAGIRAGLLWGDMGTGKTATAIEAAVQVQASSVLVLCPLSVTVHWKREWQRWGSRNACIVREATDIQRGRILIMNPDKLHSPPIRLALRALPLDVLILDENQMYKNPRAKRTKYVLGKHGLCHNATRIWLLSGTPCPQGPVDLHVPISVLWPRVLNGLSRDQFIEHYHILSPDGLRVVGTRRMPELQQRLAPYVRRRRIEECALPPLRFAPMPLSQEDLRYDKNVVAALLKAASAIAWRECSDEQLLSLVRDETVHLSTLRMLLATAKVPIIGNMAASELLDGRPKLVIFSWHVTPLNMLAEMLRPFAMTLLLTGATPPAARQPMIDRFQTDPDARVILLQGDAGGLGVTLHAANEAWFIDCPWTPSSLLQAAKRLHRIGQTQPVLARVFSVDDTIDDAVTRVILRKAELITDLQPDAAERELLECILS